MKLLGAFAPLSLVLGVLSQTPDGFIPVVETNLPAMFAQFNVTISPPGLLLPRADTADMPTLTAPNVTSATSLYIVFMIDRNVTRNDTTTTLLHWFQPNLLVTDNILSATITAVNASTAVGASYLQPSPPQGSGPHDYTLLLFEQPSMFTVPANYVMINPPSETTARIGFNITDFMAASGLSMPIAANYFRVLNGTAAQTSSFTSSFAAATTVMSASLTTFTGTVSGSHTITGTSIVSTATSAASASQSAGNGAVDVKGGAKDAFIGLALAVVGAGMWIA